MKKAFLQKPINYFLIGLLTILLFQTDTANYLNYIYAGIFFSICVNKTDSKNLKGYNILNYILHWIGEYSTYQYVRSVSLVSHIFLLSLLYIFTVYKDYSHKEISEDERFLKGFMELGKRFIAPTILYSLSYSVVWFVGLLGNHSLSQLAILLTGAFYFATLSVYQEKENNKSLSGNWFSKFVNNIYLPISLVLSLIVVMESFYFLISPNNHGLLYDFQLITFIILILNNLFLGNFIDKANKYKKYSNILEIIILLLLIALVLKFKVNNTYLYTTGYLSLFTAGYILWKDNRITKKTLLLLSTLLYLSPVVGFMNNPYKIAKMDNSSVIKVLKQRSYMPYEEDDQKKVTETFFGDTKPEFVTISKDRNTSINISDVTIQINKDKLYIIKDKSKTLINYSNKDFNFIPPLIITKDKKVIYIEKVYRVNKEIETVDLRIEE